jgi:hypothetical protein
LRHDLWRRLRRRMILHLRLGRTLVFDIYHGLRGCGRRGENENPGKSEHRGAHVSFLRFDAGNF